MGDYATDCSSTVQPPATASPFAEDAAPAPQSRWDLASVSPAPALPPPTPADIDLAVGHYADAPRPQAPMPSGPYAKAYSDHGNVGVGIGLMDGPIGDDATGSVMSANAHGGHWKDSNGVDTYGAEANAQLVHLNIGPSKGRPFGVDGGVLDANANAIASSDETGFGAGANIIDGAATIGTKDNQVRVGGSVGVGMGMRYHHSLDPETGKRSYGLGVDGGPLSADLKTDLFSPVELVHPDTPQGEMDQTQAPRVLLPTAVAYATPEKDKKAP